MSKVINNRTGQSSLEFTIVLGLLIIPALIAGFAWAKTDWKKNEWAYQSFKEARIKMIHTQLLTTVNGITLIPLENLDQNKGGIDVSVILKEVSQLWEQLSSSSPSSPQLDSLPSSIKLETE